jgi:hypothetical protein
MPLAAELSATPIQGLTPGIAAGAMAAVRHNTPMAKPITIRTVNQMAEQQSKYNEANTLQENQEHSEEAMHTNTLNTINANVGQTNWNGGNPYGGCCYDGDGNGSSTGEALGAAALGAVSEMAIGSMMTSAAQAPSTTVIQTAPPYGYSSPPLNTTLYSLPPGAYPTTINSSTYDVVGSA